MTEWRYIRAFADHFRRCGLHDGEAVAVFSESTSRPVLVETARLAAQMLGGRVYDVVVPTPSSTHPVPIRSTGASQAIAGNPGVVAALGAADLVIDCTVEGLLHSPDLGAVLGLGARVLMISNEHPDTYDRLTWTTTCPGVSPSGTSGWRRPPSCTSRVRTAPISPSGSPARSPRGPPDSPTARGPSPTGRAVWCWRSPLPAASPVES